MVRAKGYPTGRCWRTGFVLLGLVVTLLSPGTAASVAAEEQQPYKVTEIVVDRTVRDRQCCLLTMSGKWVVVGDDHWSSSFLMAYDLETGRRLSLFKDISYGYAWLGSAPHIDGDTLVFVWSNAIRPPTPTEGREDYSLQSYRLPGDQMIGLGHATRQAGKGLRAPRVSGDTLVWAESTSDDWNIYARVLQGTDVVPVAVRPGGQHGPAVSGNVVVWMDQRDVPEPAYLANTGAGQADIYGYDLTAKREFRVTARPELIGPPAIAGNTVVWSAVRDGKLHVLGYDIAQRKELTLAVSDKQAVPTQVEISGDLVVWTAMGERDQDVFGYDLRLGSPFLISRAIGNQSQARISGRAVVWLDDRHSGAGKDEDSTAIYGARLERVSSPPPPAVGVPQAVDAKIEVVWTGDKPVQDADTANVSTSLFLRDTLNLVPCQWNPRVQLWAAVNNQPARPAGAMKKAAGLRPGAGKAAPSFEYDDLDVSAARDPLNKYYFFPVVDDASTRRNVWSHGADARTYFPQQDRPTGLGTTANGVDAKIEIVWPQGGRPVNQATRVNVSALLFQRDSLLSVPSDWNPTVRLYRALNTGVSQPTAVGTKRVVREGNLTYPAWDFNDVDVTAATDPANKLYFSLDVEGAATYTNIWAHAADARTYFPQVDTPTAACQ